MLTLVLLTGASMALTLDVTDFGAIPDSGRDATAPFQKAVLAAKAAKAPVTLRIPAGRYDFFPKDATRRACFYSNATEEDSDGVRTIAIDLSGVNDLTVEGDGAYLIMRGAMTMLVAEHCANLTLKGLEFDFARPTVSEMTAIEKGDRYWVGQVHPDSPYRIEGNRLRWLGEGWEGFHNLTQHYDPVRQTVWRGNDVTASASRIEPLGERKVKFWTTPDVLKTVEVGRTNQFRDTRRSEIGMWFNRCQNVAMRDVRVRAMAGFGVLFQFTENVDLRGIEVAPDPKRGRTCASAADILHFSGCRGRIRVADSVLSAAHDDAINIHGTHLRVLEKLDDRRIKVRFMHGQTWGFAAFQAGDEIEFVRKDSLQTYAQAKVVACATTQDPRVQILTLAEAVPSELRGDSDAIENVTWTPSVEIVNCDISKVPTRGILVTTRRLVRIERNRFWRTPMPAILLEDDAAGWYESGPVRDLLVTRNEFIECAGPVIQINPQNSTHEGPVHRNIRVLDNLFRQTGHPLVWAKSTDDLSVIGNRYESSDDRTLTEADWVSARDVTKLRVGGNRYLPE